MLFLALLSIHNPKILLLKYISICKCKYTCIHAADLSNENNKTHLNNKKICQSNSMTGCQECGKTVAGKM